MRTVKVDTDFGTVAATWEREGRMIIVRYGNRTKKAQASDDDAANDIVARDILRGWIAEDLREE